ncbi:heavy metal sensor histidine kinase [Roseateles sp.]|uniref:heavy metal sensor histidine kinase n=1 Tax=Roseateles sp. TaxID=1971397 RepID=UPI0032632822
MNRHPGRKVPLALGQRLSLWLAGQTFLGLALVSVVVYVLTALDLDSRQAESLQQKRELIEHVLSEARGDRDLPSLKHKLDDFFLGHRDLALALRQPDGSMLYENAASAHAFGPIKRSTFQLEHWEPASAPLAAEMVLNISADQKFLRRLGLTLMTASLIGAVIVSVGSFLLVRRGLGPVHHLVEQTRHLAVEKLHERLDGSMQPRELQPLVKQFNALLARLSHAYAQLEGFNADVAHELRTPLATLITSTEVALRDPSLPHATADLLGSNLEELRRMTGIVNDMLFLSHANSGAVARCQLVPSVAALAGDVVEYHEAALAEAGLTVVIQGDGVGHLDASLLKRALSNLLGNATRYGTPHSTIQVRIESPRPGVIELSVANRGPRIPPEHLPRLFDRFYRADPARAMASVNHGLGLSIVAAIARMHGGEPFATSGGEGTRVGLTMQHRAGDA